MTYIKIFVFISNYYIILIQTAFWGENFPTNLGPIYMVEGKNYFTKFFQNC